jgi:competence protein ComEC
LEALIHFIDVVQVDSIFIDLPEHNILIGGGAKLDIVVGTQAHSDHIGGLIEILISIQKKEVIELVVAHTSKLVEDFLNVIEEKNINLPKLE